MESLNIAQIALRLVFALAVVIWGWYTPPLQQMITGIAGGALLLTAVKPGGRLAVLLDVLAVSVLQVYSPLWLPLGAWTIAVHRRYARSAALLLIPALFIRAWLVDESFLGWAILLGLVWGYLGFTLSEQRKEGEEDIGLLLPLPDDLREQWEQEREAHRQLRYQYQELVGAHRHLLAQRQIDRACLQILRIALTAEGQREGVRQMLSVLCDVTGAEEGALWVLEEAPSALRLAYAPASREVSPVIPLPHTQEKGFAQAVLERLRNALQAQDAGMSLSLLQDEKGVVGAVALFHQQDSKTEFASDERFRQVRETLSLAVRAVLEHHAILQQNRMLNALYEIGRLLLESQSVEDSAGKFTSVVAELLPAPFITLYLRDRDTGTLRIAACVGEPIQWADDDQTGDDESVLSRIVQNAQPLYLPHASAEPRLIRYASKRLFASLIGAPLLARERVEGVLLAGHPQPGYFGEHHLETLISAANQFAQVMEVSRLTRSVGLLALTDGLTGLFNRRYLELRLDEEVRRSQRYGKRFSLILIDVDHFKRINDTWGHATGDLVLQTVGRILSDNLRETELVFRYGGEELLILLPETPLKQAVEVARRLCQVVANYPFRTVDGMKTFRVTLSAGVAEYPTHGTDKLTLLAAADRALYLAKQQGRNRVEMLSPAA
ncbi:MAG: sensor domain-containing diguanylate cyclase [Chthonomonadetes bacterium]|nr:sensor domain-containing diguanylate cyclase [Chthonomonadetes bacterium]